MPAEAFYEPDWRNGKNICWCRQSRHGLLNEWFYGIPAGIPGRGAMG
jgi:hypothetical protein